MRAASSGSVTVGVWSSGAGTRCSEFGSGHLTLVLGCGSTSQAEPPVLHGWLGEDILDGGRSMSDYSRDDRGGQFM